MAEGNGAPRWRDIERLDRQDRVLEEGQRWLSRMGERHNEQIRELHDDMVRVKDAVADMPVVKRDAQQALEGWKSVRTALYTAGGGFALLAASLLVTGGPG